MESYVIKINGKYLNISWLVDYKIFELVLTDDLELACLFDTELEAQDKLRYFLRRGTTPAIYSSQVIKVKNKLVEVGD